MSSGPLPTSWCILFCDILCHSSIIVRNMTPKKWPKSWKPLHIVNTAWRPIFLDQNFLNFSKIFVYPCDFCPKIGEKRRLLHWCQKRLKSLKYLTAWLITSFCREIFEIKQCFWAWDTNQGSLNGLQALRRFQKNLSPWPWLLHFQVNYAILLKISDCLTTQLVMRYI